MKRLLIPKTNLNYSEIVPTRTNISAVFNLSIFLSVLKKGAIAMAIVLMFTSSYGQNGEENQQAKYKAVIKERAEKIVDLLGITDSGKYNLVLNEVINQYYNLNTIHDQHKAAVAEIKQKNLPGNESETAIQKLDQEKSSQLLQRHTAYIEHLKRNLTDEQLEKVKDGMTYKVFPITYAGYLDMLTNLTAEQKQQIYTWLKEARELAMDEGSSERKHQVFGKYKGRINNYLSKAGYDLKKESKAWQERIKEK